MPVSKKFSDIGGYWEGEVAKGGCLCFNYRLGCLAGMLGWVVKICVVPGFSISDGQLPSGSGFWNLAYYLLVSWFCSESDFQILFEIIVCCGLALHELCIST